MHQSLMCIELGRSCSNVSFLVNHSRTSANIETEKDRRRGAQPSWVKGRGAPGRPVRALGDG